MISVPTELCSWKDLSILMSRTQRISTCLYAIRLRLSNLFLIELMFRYGKNEIVMISDSQRFQLSQGIR